MRILPAAPPVLLAVLLLAGCSARRPPVQPTAELDTRGVIATPLEQTLGAEEADRIRAMAEVNGMLRHCHLRWEGYFGRMTAQQRDVQRSDAEMQRIATWHGYWLGATQRAADRDQIACTPELQIALRDRAEGLLRLAPAP